MSPRAAPKKKPAPTKKAATTKKAAPKKRAAPAVKPAPRPKAAPKKKAALKQKPLPSSGRVLDIVTDEDPIGALRWFLDSVPGVLTRKTGQIALSAAHLILPNARENGRHEVEDLFDLVLGAWNRFTDRTGFHAQEFLRSALAIVGEDHDEDRLAQLLALIPDDASPELQQAVAMAYAQTHIPVEVSRLVRPVRGAFERVQAILEKYGEAVVLGPPVNLDTILAAERAARIHLPSDYRAMLTVTDGCTLFDRQFLSLADYRVDTDLGREARRHLDGDCVPIARWERDGWLVYDARGSLRGVPGYIVLPPVEGPFDDLVGVLDGITAFARDVLATN